MEQMLLDYENWAIIAERLPLNQLEWMCLGLAAVMVVGILRCLLTQGRRFFGSDRLLFKVMGWMLILNCMGHAVIAFALIEKGLTGFTNEPKLVLGIAMLVAGRYAIQMLHSNKKRLAGKRK